jgi:beta-glucosidase
MTKEPGFPPEFLWGAATSAYQIEGAVDADGRCVSIWDTFSHTPGTTRDGDTGDVACDHFHRYREDVALMADLGLGAYRFSIAWPRVQPDGSGRPNQRGLDFYRRLVEELLGRGIQPAATLFHWDLPQALEDQGGWTSRDTALRFGEYAGIVAEGLAGEVGTWITLNEPWVAAWLGYGTGQHAPGRTDVREALSAAHHLLLAHGFAVDALRASGSTNVGITLDILPIVPASESPRDEEAAHLADAHRNRFFLEAVLGPGYPAELVARFASSVDLRFVLDGDASIIARPIDFLGLNYYRREVASSASPSGIAAEPLPGLERVWTYPPPGVPATSMGWGIEPDGLLELLLRVHREHPGTTLYVTENGAAFPDRVGPDGSVEDPERVAYLRGHVRAAHRAVRAGVPLKGYFVWSLLDNFEWAEGYSKRFGLVHVDFETQRRTPKASARWYASVARGQWPPP